MNRSQIDRILALQVTVAWAGEAAPHLGWWETGLFDREAGADFLRRLLPHTHAWAALRAVCQAARRKDERMRKRMAKSDGIMTLFHFGFEIDKALGERWDEHRMRGLAPADVFGPAYGVRERFDRSAFEAFLVGLANEVPFEVVPGGRQLAAERGSPDQAALRFARALLPLAPTYPMPFCLRAAGPSAPPRAAEVA